MAIIKIDDLSNYHVQIFSNSQKYLKNLNHQEAQLIYGGKGNDFSLLLNYAFAGLAIHSIRRIADSFME